MTAEAFADTNLIIYAGSKDSADAEKKKVARQLLLSEDLGLSVQVLQEFIAATAARKRLGINESEARDTIIALLAFPVAPITTDLLIDALGIKARFRISYWDAAIIAAARELQCKVIYSEDLNAGELYDGIRVVNPFSK
jgi:predicted nucleic acid-binding protein